MPRLVWLLAAVSLVGYALRTNISIAQEFMAPELGLSMAQMGVISAWGFQLAYALFQLPAGFLGDRYGARQILGLSIIGWAIASLLSGLVGGAPGVAFSLLFGARFFLGAAEAPTYPVMAMVAAQSIPEGRRMAATALYISAGSLGTALAPVTLAPLMVHAGWRATFIASAIVGLATALAWFALTPRRPERASTHRYVPMAVQLAEAARVLRHPPLLILTVSYFLHSAVYFVFVFWFFRYMTEGRGFSVLASGWYASVPPLMAFALAPVVGVIADRLSRSLSPSVARRRTAMTCLTLAAAFVLIGARLPTPLLAVVALGASMACLVSVEAPFWTTTTSIAPEAAGTAGGVLNLMGNLGGVLSIWLVPLMKDAMGWTPLLTVWAGVAIVAAVLWLGVRVRDPVVPSERAAA